MLDLIGWFRNRKREKENNLKFAQTQPGFKLFQVTAGGGQIDITEQHKKQLQDDIAEYQRLIEELQIVATGATPLSKKTFDIK
jgi:hypothetical protein